MVAFGILAFAAGVRAQEIHIKARFFEVPRATLETLQKNFVVANDGTERLTPEQMNSTLKNLRSNPDAKLLSGPEVTTSSGRQTQMRATKIQTVLTNFTLQENSGNSSVVPQSEKIECGSILDVIPAISSGGQKIDLKTTASFVRFFGYADPSGSPSRFATNSAGEKVNLPIILPVLQVNRASAQSTLSDGQTLVLFPKANVEQDQRLARHIAQAEKKSGGKFFVVMITPTIVDTAGNPIHSGN